MDKMRKIIGMFIILSMATLSTTSCRYVEGGGVGKVLNRIRGQWEITEITKNGEKTSSAAYEEQVAGIMEFYRTQVYLLYYNEGSTTCVCEGSWEFSEDKKELIVNYRGKYQIISREYTILKFSNHKLKLAYTDDKGDKWTILLELVISFIEYGY